MKVYIDLSYLGDGRITGIERFALEIYKCLRSSEAFEYVCLLPKNFKDLNLNVTNIILPFENKMLCHFIYPFFVSGGAMVFLPAFPASPLIWLKKFLGLDIRVCRVIHDVVPWVNPETIPWKAKLYFKPMEEFGLRRTDKILTVSKYSLDKIEKTLGVSVSGVVYNGVAPVFNSGGPRKYKDTIFKLLSVGTIEPRKNFEFLVSLVEAMISRNIPVELSICGRKGWGYDDLIDRVQSSSAKKFITIKTGLSDKELSDVYADSTIFLYPSFEEGFGIPLVEAMAAGLPVLAVKGSAITEVVSDGGILQDDYNINDWISRFVEISSNPDFYEELSQKAIVRSKDFSWVASMEKLEKEFGCEK